MARDGTASGRTSADPVSQRVMRCHQKLKTRSCQCGVSRSATLAVAYVMSLAASGLLPEKLGHLSGMQDAYEFVKSQSPWIGPNVSKVPLSFITHYR